MGLHNNYEVFILYYIIRHLDISNRYRLTLSSYYCYNFQLFFIHIYMVQNLRKKAFILSVFTVSYNIIEGIVSIIAGILSNSIALKGFGIDSFIESISGAVMIWRFRKRGKISEEEEERVERIAQKLVAVSFFILSAYILYESISKFLFPFDSKVSDPFYNQTRFRVKVLPLDTMHKQIRTLP